MAEVIVILAVAVIIISLFIHMKKCGSKKAAITITGDNREFHGANNLQNGRKTQILQLDPQTELVFKGPFTDAISAANLKLTNPTTRTVIFKIKTSAPRHYCVRPISGVLYPNKDTNICVMLRAINLESCPDRHTDKFMVQAMLVPADFNVMLLDDAFAQASSADLMSSKLRCTFISFDEPPAYEEPSAQKLRLLQEKVKELGLANFQCNDKIRKLKEEFRQTKVDLERRAYLAEQRAMKLETQWVLRRDEINITQQAFGEGVKVAKFRGTKVLAHELEIQADYCHELFVHEINTVVRLSTNLRSILLFEKGGLCQEQTVWMFAKL